MKVLAIDDDPMSLRITQSMIASLGHECTTAGNGTEGWHAYRRLHPDVIISDLSMPGLSGSELCQAVRARGSGPYTYFVLVTSYGSPEDTLVGMDAGADDYLVKPLRMADLQTRLIAAARLTSLHRRLDVHRVSLEQRNRELATAAAIDPLTGFGNRRALNEDLEVLAARVIRYGHTYCMGLVDLDYFKSFNDRYGHVAGDNALRDVAAQLRKQARGGDSWYRYGGDELLCLLPEQSLSQATTALERMRRGVEELGIEHSHNPRGVVTLSAGVTRMDADRLRSGEDVLLQADEALYRAKAMGRNHVGSIDGSVRDRR